MRAHEEGSRGADVRDPGEGVGPTLDPPNELRGGRREGHLAVSDSLSSLVGLKHIKCSVRCRRPQMASSAVRDVKAWPLVNHAQEMVFITPI